MPYPKMGFTPDAAFPVVYGEKAGCGFEITGHVEKGGLIYLCAGSRPNIVPETCEAVIEGNYKQYTESYKKFLNTNNLTGDIEEEGNHTKLILKGKWRSTAPNNKITVHSNQTETVLIVTCQHGQPVEFTLSRE